MPDVGQWGPEPFLDLRGRPRTDITATVYEPDGTTLATLYADQSGTTALANPLPTGVATTTAGLDVRGNGSFYAEPGPYVLVVARGGTEVYRSPITVAADDDTAGGGGPGAVTSVNTQTGAVVLDAGDVGADPAGAAAAAQAFAIQRANQTGTQAQATIVGLVADLAAKALQTDLDAEEAARLAADLLLIPLTQKGAASGVATLDGAGLIPTTQLPGLAISSTFVVANQAAMLALAAQEGDVAVRTDEAKSYILRVEPATVLANWEWLRTPTDLVTSVEGRQGAVTLGDLYDALGAAAAAQAHAIQRGNHTGTQLAATITDFAAAAIAAVAGTYVPQDLSGLTGSSAPDADDLVYIWLDGAPRKVALSDLAALILANAVLTGTVTVPDGALAIADTNGLQTALDGKQTLHANLTALAGLSLIADRLPYANGTGTLALATLTSFARTLLDDADASTALTTLGVSTFIKTLLDDADAATALATLGAQASDAELSAIAGLTSAADRLPYFTGSGTAALATFTAAARALLDDADADAMLATLGAIDRENGGLETVQAHGNTGSTETFDLANGNVHTAAQDQACTYTLSGFTNGKACSMTLILTSVTGAATWPAAVKWPDATAPTLSGVTIITFLSTDGGTTIYGFPGGKAFA